MANIVWLDDEPGYVQEAIARLRLAGHKVDVVISDEQLAKRLENVPLPEVVIQDLFRPGFEGEDYSSFGWEVLRGWRLYEEFLKPKHPSIAVIICSMGAEEIANRKRADDFNLVLLHKVGLEDRICATVNAVLNAQSPVFAALALPPAIMAVDFSKVNSGLIDHLARHPDDIHRINWGTFEELVERLLKELDYEVFRTPLTRDGGVDLWAVSRSDLGEVLYAIDAKKYSPKRLVGPEPVRAIHGVANMTGSSVGMIVTTSHFSPDAIALANQFRYKLSLQDFDRVSLWIKKVSGEENLALEAPNSTLHRTPTALSCGRRR
jgi:HJR/Mrr/RecB family endonuclease